MNKNFIAVLILFSVIGFSQDESFDNETLSMFDGVLSYDQKMNRLNDLVAKTRTSYFKRAIMDTLKQRKKHCYKYSTKEQKSAAQEEPYKLGSILLNICNL